MDVDDLEIEFPSLFEEIFGPPAAAAGHAPHIGKPFVAADGPVLVAIAAHGPVPADAAEPYAGDSDDKADFILGLGKSACDAR